MQLPDTNNSEAPLSWINLKQALSQQILLLADWILFTKESVERSEVSAAHCPKSPENPNTHWLTWMQPSLTSPWMTGKHRDATGGPLGRRGLRGSAGLRPCI